MKMDNMQIQFLYEKSNLKKAPITTPLGSMIAITDESSLHALAFADGVNRGREFNVINRAADASITNGRTAILDLLEQELAYYFEGSLTAFKTPISLKGSLFQTTVWQQLQKIPFGSTASYGEIAAAIDKPTAYRAVAQANATNHLVIIVPCHRVITSNGTLGGFSAGLHRKEWLLNHEKK